MKRFIPTTLILLSALQIRPEQPSRNIHIYVALCDNIHQGIVPVPKRLGNGRDAGNNLYWGAAFGMKTFLKNSFPWKTIASLPANENLAERLIFKHKSEKIWLIADAYFGDRIKNAIGDFLEAAAGVKNEIIRIKSNEVPQEIPIHGNAGLLIYVGHDGLMDFELQKYPGNSEGKIRDAMVFACMSQQYFSKPLKLAGARPLLLTRGLMAPEAYTVAAAMEAWILNRSPQEIVLEAAKTYNRYQHCGLSAAQKLFTSETSQ